MPSTLVSAYAGDIHFDWYPNPIVVARELGALDRALSDMVVPLETARELAARNIAEHFETKTDPDGAPWPEWSESYEASGRGNELMVQSGETMAAASSESAFDLELTATGGTLIYTGAGVPDRGFMHHFGAADRLTRWGTPNPLPRRAFMGIDSATQMAIVAEFDAWVGGIVGGFGGGGFTSYGGSPVSIFTHPGGREQFRVGGWWGPNVT